MIGQLQDQFSGMHGARAQSDAIMEEARRRLQAKISSINIKGGGGLRTYKGGGNTVLSMDSDDGGFIKTKYEIPKRRQWFEVRGEYPDQVVAINYIGPYMYLPGSGNPKMAQVSLDGLPLTWTPQPTIPLGSGVKIYMKFTATVSGIDMNDIASPPDTVRIANSFVISNAGITLEYGDYSYSPSSTAGTTSSGPPVDTTKTIYKFLLRVDANGDQDLLTAGEWVTEDANNPMQFRGKDYGPQWFFAAG